MDIVNIRDQLIRKYYRELNHFFWILHNNSHVRTTRKQELEALIKVEKEYIIPLKRALIFLINIEGEGKTNENPEDKTLS